MKLSQTNSSIVMDDVFERIGNYESNSTNIFELLMNETQSYNETECQNRTTSCSDTDEGFGMHAKVGFSGNWSIKVKTLSFSCGKSSSNPVNCESNDRDNYLFFGQLASFKPI